METKNRNKIDAVKMARDAKDKLDKKLSNMTKEQVVEYFKQQRKKSNQVKPRAYQRIQFYSYINAKYKPFVY